VPPRDSSAPRNSAPPRPSTVPKRPIRAGQVVAVVLVLLMTMLLGAGLVAWVDRGPVHHPTTSKSTLDGFSLASVYDFFFPPREHH